MVQDRLSRLASPHRRPRRHVAGIQPTALLARAANTGRCHCWSRKRIRSKFLNCSIGSIAPTRTRPSALGPPRSTIALDHRNGRVPSPACAGFAPSWADQGRRAAISIVITLREGAAYLAHRGANPAHAASADSSPFRRRCDDIAHASAFEVEAVLDVASCSGFDGVNHRAARALGGRIAAMTTALVRWR